jgi:nucleotide-binding universal stress UspA family protein
MSGRILVGYDHTEEAAAGLRRAVALAQSERAELTVVHVAVPPPAWVGVGMLALPVFDDVVDTGAQLVLRAIDGLPDDLALRWHLVSGPEASSSIRRHRCVRHALGQALEDGDHDLLVLGTGLTPGRVAAWLARRMPERVVTARFSPGPGQASGGSSAPKMLPSVSLK